MDSPIDDRQEALLRSHQAAASPALRYSAVHPVRLDGWLAKEGKALRTRRTRFIRLSGHLLSSHRTKHAPPSWQISVADAIVEKGVNSREIKLSLPHRTFSFVAPTQRTFEVWIVALRRASIVSSRVDDFYRIGRLIGEGMNGQVRIAQDLLTDEYVAVKMIPRLGRENETEFLAREVQIILSINHPNIVTTIDVFVRSKRIHFVMEYLAGGELFDFIAENTNFTEAHAATVMTDLLRALNYLHSRGIAHRDVKLENLLCANTTWPLHVKLADFGFANYVPTANERVLSSFVGTPYYIAPEMLRANPHGRPVDVWASGVVMYILLSGKFPFGGNNESEYYERVLSKEAYFPEEEWSSVSEEAKDLVRGMLCKDPDKRLTSEQALQHPWLKRADSHSEGEFPLDVPSSSQNLQSPNALRDNKEKRGKWRHIAMLNHSLSSPTDHALEIRQVPVKDGAQSRDKSQSVRDETGIFHDDPTINRRPSLIRRLLSSGKLSLDRYDGRFPSFRGNPEESADEASATPRKALSLFSKDGPLRRSFHRSEHRSSDGINFVNSQSQRLPPKIARERQRQQKQAEAPNRISRGVTLFSPRKNNAVEPSTTVRPVAPPTRIQVPVIHPFSSVPVPAGQRGPSNEHDTIISEAVSTNANASQVTLDESIPEFPDLQSSNALEVPPEAADTEPIDERRVLRRSASATARSSGAKGGSHFVTNYETKPRILSAETVQAFMEEAPR